MINKLLIFTLFMYLVFKFIGIKVYNYEIVLIGLLLFYLLVRKLYFNNVDLIPYFSCKNKINENKKMLNNNEQSENEDSYLQYNDNTENEDDNNEENEDEDNEENEDDNNEENEDDESEDNEDGNDIEKDKENIKASKEKLGKNSRSMIINDVDYTENETEKYSELNNVGLYDRNGNNKEKKEYGNLDKLIRKSVHKQLLEQDNYLNKESEDTHIGKYEDYMIGKERSYMPWNKI